MSDLLIIQSINCRESIELLAKIEASTLRLENIIIDTQVTQSEDHLVEQEFVYFPSQRIWVTRESRQVSTTLHATEQDGQPPIITFKSISIPVLPKNMIKICSFFILLIPLDKKKKKEKGFLIDIIIFFKWSPTVQLFRIFHLKVFNSPFHKKIK